ncbi:ATP-binding protein [Nostoc sp. 'Peltigera membranacea cyanobiont' 210A]|uniref:AAA family ATPase n=1 Tax=Nostoc sp. 'Peltigera membranacea cyanobiont' 210A TaxID=2014529 RepID=UPI000B957160|nr:AAA family ATPase [Nostoc sp. 'Peltigera membranacea cyanobiont' 210A]OYD95436.1 ATP-binding protein [Nostoc sp. 'Peltigera membranacea cyanobiont' 210A]
MKLKRLKMQSFRGIGDLTLEFDETSPTALIGINGVGKSSILDCLAILLSQMIRDIAYAESIKTNMQFINNLSYRSSNRHEYDKSIPGKPDIEERFFSEDDITNGHKETHNRIKIFLQSREVSWFVTNSSKESNEDIKKENAELNTVTQDIYRQWKSNSKFNLPLAVYYPVKRSVLGIDMEITETHSLKQIDAYDQALNGVQISFHRFFQWFRSLEDLENEERRDNPEFKTQQLEAVRQSIYSLIPGFSNLRVRRSPLRMTVRKQGEELTVNQLSDGEKCLLAMVGDLARRLAIANPGLTEPLQGEGVVLIDEIELHLHPKWQREIIPALTRTFPNCQFIVTTHSPQVISQVKPEGIYILEKTDEGVVAKKPESSFGRDSNRILEDLMGVPERPQEIKESLLELFRLIDAGNIEGARQLRQQLAIEIGADEPEFVKADVLIRRKEILNR